MSSNPQTIIYAKDLPEEGCACGCDQGNDFYTPPVDPNSRPVSILTNDPQITVSDLSDSSKWKFNIDFIPYDALSGALSITPKASTVTKPNPALKGETIDELDLAWSWNKAVTSQSLANDGGISNPSLNTAERTKNISGLSITSDTKFTLSGDDGSGLPGATKDLVASIKFGNYFYYGKGATKVNLATSGLQALFDGFSGKDIATARQKSVFPTGGEDEHFFIAYPKAYGLPTDIKQGVFSGGYIRLKNVSGTLVEEVPGGQSESDISISNGLASEAYYVFMSTFDNQLDPNVPVEIL